MASMNGSSMATQQSGRSYNNMPMYGGNGHYGDHVQNDNRQYVVNIFYNCRGDCSHEPGSIAISTAVRSNNDLNGDSRPVPQNGLQTTPDRPSRTVDMDAKAVNSSPRAQLTLPAPLRKEDEPLLVKELGRAGYDASTLSQLLERLRSKPAHEQATRATQAADCTHKSPPPLRSNNAAAARSGLRRAQIEAAQAARSAAELANAFEALARSYRVDTSQWSHEHKETLVRAPREEQTRRLLYALHSQDEKTYEMVVAALRRQNGLAFVGDSRTRARQGAGDDGDSSSDEERFGGCACGGVSSARLWTEEAGNMQTDPDETAPTPNFCEQ